MCHNDHVWFRVYNKNELCYVNNVCGMRKEGGEDEVEEKHG